MSDLGECCVCGNMVRLRPGWLLPRAVVTHDHPIPCRSVCAGSGLPARVSGDNPRPVSEQARLDTGRGLSAYADPVQKQGQHAPRQHDAPDLADLGVWDDDVDQHPADRERLDKGDHTASMPPIVHCLKCRRIPAPLYRAAKWDERHLCVECDKRVARGLQ